MGGNAVKVMLILLVQVGLASEVTLVKTIRKEPDASPVCTSITLDIITLIICKVTTERYGKDECSLMYRYEQDFEQSCDSKIKLLKENQTVFLHLTDLTPVDSGNYTCECSYDGGTDFLHLSVTVEVDEDDDDKVSTSSPIKVPIVIAVISVTAFIIVTAVILGFILSKRHQRENTRSRASDLHKCESPCSLDQDDQSAYAKLEHQDTDLYQTVANPSRKTRK